MAQPMTVRLVIATRNRHKVQEIRAVMPSHFEFLALEDFSEAPLVQEDADSFAGNAVKKSTGLAAWLSLKPSGIPNPSGRVRVYVLADDSGLEVDALGGAPGIHSARFAAGGIGQAGNSSDAENNAKLLRLLSRVPNAKRTARFRCAVALTWVRSPSGPDMRTVTPPELISEPRPEGTRVFDGVCEGNILFQPRGGNGFGYDPLFVPAGYDWTFAELGEEVKNRISHRAKALAKLGEFFNAQRTDFSGPERHSLCQ
jgi:XTP/dITP diphosphohydrolase